VTVRAKWVPNEPANLLRIQEGVTVVGNSQWEDAWTEGIAGAYLPALLGRLADRGDGEPVAALRDDNRSCLLPDRTVNVDDTEYFLSVKGCGAEFDAFTPVKLSPSRLRTVCHDPRLAERLSQEPAADTPFIVGERWWGYAPYGGQAGDSALLALLASSRADRNQIAGFFICPVIAAVRLPDPIAELASQFYWYRRYDGAYWQELRLMPSNVRLYFHSPVTLGLDSGRVFSLFGLTDLATCEAFLERLMRSTVAAITLFARTVRFDDVHARFTGLDYDEVYLDKDAVIAPDGTLHFADLEGVEGFHAAGPREVRQRIEDQYFHNLYEATYAIEAMAQETYRLLGLTDSLPDRHRWTLDVLERACRPDPYVRVERGRDRTTMVITPAAAEADATVELEWATEGAVL